MIIGKLRQLRLHWWILLGIVIGGVWGSWLNVNYYQDFMQIAQLEILGDTPTKGEIASHGSEIHDYVRLLMRQTFAGGLAYGLSGAFMNLLRMLVIPLVMASLICGVARMQSLHTLRTIGSKALVWYLTTSFLAVMAGVFVVNLIRPGYGVDIAMPVDVLNISVPESMWDLLLAMIPENIFRSAMQFELLPLIFFSILFGIFMLAIGTEQRAPIEKFMESVFDVMMKMTLFVISLAPIGIAALIANLVATTGAEVFHSLAGYVLSVVIALGLHFFITLPLLFWIFTRRNPYYVMGAMAPALMTAFSTTSSTGTLPLTMERTERGVGVSSRITGFVLPLGATINMDGTALYECVAVLFIAQLYAYANPAFMLTVEMQLIIVVLSLLVSIGAAGIPHAGLVMMIIIFEAIGLPLEFIALLWAVERPLDMGRTMTNVWSDSLGAVMVAHTENEIDETILFKASS